MPLRSLDFSNFWMTLAFSLSSAATKCFVLSCSRISTKTQAARVFRQSSRFLSMTEASCDVKSSLLSLVSASSLTSSFRTLCRSGCPMRISSLCFFCIYLNISSRASDSWTWPSSILAAKTLLKSGLFYVSIKYQSIFSSKKVSRGFVQIFISSSRRTAGSFLDVECSCMASKASISSC